MRHRPNEIFELIVRDMHHNQFHTAGKDYFTYMLPGGDNIYVIKSDAEIIKRIHENSDSVFRRFWERPAPSGTENWFVEDANGITDTVMQSESFRVEEIEPVLERDPSTQLMETRFRVNALFSSGRKGSFGLDFIEQNILSRIVKYDLEDYVERVEEPKKEPLSNRYKKAGMWQ